MYRKFLAQTLFTGQQLLANNQLVLVTSADGTIEALLPEAEAGDGIEHVEGLLCPGFINAHCHLELSHLQGAIPEKTGMVGFIFGVMGKRDEPQMAYGGTKMADKTDKPTSVIRNPPSTISSPPSAIQNADKRMWANGIQAVGDICNTANTIATKQNSAIRYHNFVEVSGFVPAGAAARFATGTAVAQAFGQHFPPGQTSITPHAPYSVSKQLFEMIAAEGPAIVSVHSQESQAEQDIINNKTGDLLQLYKALGVDISFFAPPHKSSLPYMLPMLPAAAQKLFVHNCFTNQADLDFLAANSNPATAHFFCLCPNANLYIGNPLPNVPLLAHSGFRLCLGTDSLASNHQLSILEEMKTLQHHFPALATETILQWGTLNGARALKMEEHFGSFAKGKKPGLIQLTGLEAGRFSIGSRVKRLL